MQVVHERCSGLDVHKKIVTACCITPEGKETRTFGTMTDELPAMADWLRSKGCTHVARESTGVYWKPVYNLLEDYEFVHRALPRPVVSARSSERDSRCDGQPEPALLARGGTRYKKKS